MARGEVGGNLRHDLLTDTLRVGQQPEQRIGHHQSASHLDGSRALRRRESPLHGRDPGPGVYSGDTPGDIGFLAEHRGAFAKVLDKLLASPQYGERWGRIWLDVARFGEDDYRSLNPNPRGYFPYPNAFMYRDWVIQAMNDDLPYDQFVKAQIAGDLLHDAKLLPALGFFGLGPWYYDITVPPQARAACCIKAASELSACGPMKGCAMACAK